MNSFLASKQANLQTSLRKRAGAIRGSRPPKRLRPTQRLSSAAHRGAKRGGSPAMPRAPRKARLAWRGAKLAWGVLLAEAKIVGRGAWLGGRISGAVGARRRAGASPHRLAALRWAALGAAAMYLLDPRRRRRGMGSTPAQAQGWQDSDLGADGQREGEQAGLAGGGQENGVAPQPLRTS